ncbi:MAG: cation transporter, partial [Gemmatimonadales bacterium]
MSRVTFSVTGMHCAACAATIQKRLTAAPGVRRAAVNLATNKATVDLDNGAIPTDVLIDAVRSAGYDVASDTLTVPVQGLRLFPGIERLEDLVRAVPGVRGAAVNPAAETVRVTFVSGLVPPEAIAHAIEQTGLTPAAPSETDPQEQGRAAQAAEVRDLTFKTLVAALVALAAMAASMPLMSAQAMRGTDLFVRLLMPIDGAVRGALPWLYHVDAQSLKLALLALMVPVVGWAGLGIYASAWRGFRHRSADMNTLIGVGTSAALAYSLVATFMPGVFAAAHLPADVYYEAVAAIIAFILLGRLLEARAKGRTGETLRHLAALGAKTARLLRGDTEEDIPISEVVVGDLLRVRPGEKIPV